MKNTAISVHFHQKSDQERFMLIAHTMTDEFFQLKIHRKHSHVCALELNIMNF